MSRISKLKFVQSVGLRHYNIIPYNVGRKTSITSSQASVEGYHSFLKEFRKTWPTIMNEFNTRLPSYIEDFGSTIKDKETSEWIKKALNYALEGGKRSKVIYTIGTWKILKENNIHIDEDLAFKLAFICETFNTIHVSFDDMCEGVQYRRGSLCWYRKPGIGMKAVDDFMMFHACLRQLLVKYFGNHKAFKGLQGIFTESHQAFAVGQTMDDVYLSHARDWSELTSDVYRTKAILKTATVALLPRCHGMLHLAGLAADDQKQSIEDVLLEIGYLYQIQNDYFDVYYSESTTGKGQPGEDIEGAKFTWFLSEALKITNDKQLQILKDSYGSADPEKIQRVLDVYEEMNLQSVYTELEKNHINRVIELIGKVKGVPVEVFYTAMSVIYSWINSSVNVKE